MVGENKSKLHNGSLGAAAPKHCEHCGVTISYKNWSHHVKTKKHAKHVPNVQTELMKVKTLRGVANDLNLSGVATLKKKELADHVNKVMNKTFDEQALKEQTVKQLKELAKEYKIKGLSRSRKQQIINDLMKPQHIMFKKEVAQIMPFADDLFEPARGERQPPYIITETKSRFIKKFGTTEVEYIVQITKIMEVENAINALIKLAKEKGNYKKGDKITILASHPKFNHDISTVVESDIKARTFMEHVAHILSSNEEMDITQTRFNVKIINIPKGSKGSKIINLKEDVRTKKCITQINNKDNLCCPRAIVTALTYHTDNILDRPITAMEKKCIRMGRKLQGELARELCKRLGEYNEEGFTLEDIRNAEKLLGVQIKVVCAENFNGVIYKGAEAEIILYLYKIGNHFDVINSMKAFFGSSYYCEVCDRTYNNKDGHNVCLPKRVCKLCMGAEHSESLPSVYCDKCNRYCYNQMCLANHGLVCAKIYKCKTCNKICRRPYNRKKYNKLIEHSCYHYYCHNCKEVAKYNEHECYMQRKKSKGGPCDEWCHERVQGIHATHGHCVDNCTYTEKYLFFDYEAMQDTGVHEPNLVKVHDFIGNKWSFYDNDSFCKWLISKEHKGYTCIAHNAKGYDSHFILRYCVENTIKPYTIYAGTKLMLLEVESLGLKIIDSMNFVAGALSAFPKTFGLKELKKGYFPHFFNTPENQSYVGPIPDIKYYGADTMKPDARKDFLNWHAERVKDSYVFDFRKEIEEYCDSDVDILRRGCLELRKQFLEIANVDPFCYLTIASVCMAIYRYKYIQPNTIAVVNTEQKEQHSKQSITWLETFPGVTHALNGGEATICGSRVDGYCESNNTVYQYHGCFWHGCPRCYRPDTINEVNKNSMGDLYNKTRERTEKMRRTGYNVIEMWECDWLLQYKKMDKAHVIEPLKPRDAFFGGRTNGSKLKVSGKKLRYIDVVSLYPTVMFYDNYPVGHPVKFRNPKKYNPQWYGFIKCKVLAPRGLYHPVLPVKQDKLIFPLCVKCAEEKTMVCDHTDEQRAFTGTWTTIEINKAVEKGYKILGIYEVWHFKERSNDMFKGYISDFMKIKLETSPWQKDYATKEEYAAAIKERMGIELDLDKIEDNPGKRAVAKICLNSFWGKFGQRLNLMQTKYVTEPSEFYNILLDDSLNKTNITLINDNIIQISYNLKDQFVENCYNVNVFVAAFTTANARLRLYDMLDRLGDSIAYYDTDSVVYIDDGTNTVSTGCMLSEWSDELGKDDYINDWISTGPKSYAYDTAKGEGKCKIKGFTLNWKNAQKLNMKTMKKVLDGEVKKLSVDYNQIVRDVKTKKLINKPITKEFKLEYDKRMVTEEMNGVIDTLPWGY